MIGSSRTSTSHRESARAPYAAPQALANTRPHDAASVREPLVPFVPREYRDTARDTVRQAAVQAVHQQEHQPVHRDVMAMPGAEQSQFTAGFEPPLVGSAEWVADSVAQHFGSVPSDDAPNALAADHDNAVDEVRNTDVSHEDVPTNKASTDLPWIDAFAADEPDPEETWPMGEAGKRLDELTESLSSLDASRARMERSDVSAESENGTPDASLPMWNEDEWIDIMPTSGSASAPINTEFADAVYDTPAVSADAAASHAHAPVGPELTARALEALAQRIRSGEVQVPEPQPQVAEEALLAGVLASMLGWRQ